jgi:hypothetical protein
MVKDRAIHGLGRSCHGHAIEGELTAKELLVRCSQPPNAENEKAGRGH